MRWCEKRVEYAVFFVLLCAVTFDDHVRLVEEVVSFLSSHEQEALERTEKRNTNGPDLAIPRSTRQSFVIGLESLTSLANTMTEIG